ncbi:hypothetical protein P8452_02669 [Trifolium repens]|nr:hypothetical protein P8452_02669 [Trifolium repens]
MLLGREWIHGVGAVPSTLHQRLIIWRDDGIVENVEADQSYFKTEVHHLTKHSFDKKLATISPYTERDFAHRSPGNVHHSIKLDPTHGFLWEEEDGNSEDGEYEGHNYPTGIKMALEANSLSENMAVAANDIKFGKHKPELQ